MSRFSAIDRQFGRLLDTAVDNYIPPIRTLDGGGSGKVTLESIWFLHIYTLVLLLHADRTLFHESIDCIPRYTSECGFVGFRIVG